MFVRLYLNAVTTSCSNDYFFRLSQIFLFYLCVFFIDATRTNFVSNWFDFRIWCGWFSLCAMDRFIELCARAVKEIVCWRKVSWSSVCFFGHTYPLCVMLFAWRVRDIENVCRLAGSVRWFSSCRAARFYFYSFYFECVWISILTLLLLLLSFFVVFIVVIFGCISLFLLCYVIVCWLQTIYVSIAVWTF